MKISAGIKLSSFTVLHDDVEVARVVVDLIYLDNIGMFKLSDRYSTERRI